MGSANARLRPLVVGYDPEGSSRPKMHGFRFSSCRGLMKSGQVKQWSSQVGALKNNNKHGPPRNRTPVLSHSCPLV